MIIKWFSNCNRTRHCTSWYSNIWMSKKTTGIANTAQTSLMIHSGTFKTQINTNCQRRQRFRYQFPHCSKATWPPNRGRQIYASRNETKEMRWWLFNRIYEQTSNDDSQPSAKKNKNIALELWCQFGNFLPINQTSWINERRCLGAQLIRLVTSSPFPHFWAWNTLQFFAAAMLIATDD